jgi:hypothetical protein
MVKIPNVNKEQANPRIAILAYLIENYYLL